MNRLKPYISINACTCIPSAVWMLHMHSNHDLIITIFQKICYICFKSRISILPFQHLSAIHIKLRIHINSLKSQQIPKILLFFTDYFFSIPSGTIFIKKRCVINLPVMWYFNRKKTSFFFYSLFLIIFPYSQTSCTAAAIPG